MTQFESITSMYHSIHSEFIETPLLRILEEGVQACRPLGSGIQSEPMKEYFLSSLFLRMTGAQEQKLKCICWEIATHDYGFRFDYLRGFGDPKPKYGEFSSFAQKETVYNDLLRQVFLLNNGERPGRCICLQKYKIFYGRVCREIGSLLSQDPLCYWLQKEILDFSNDVVVKSYDNGPSSPSKLKLDVEWKERTYSLLQKTLKSIYDPVVKDHRNRCAHNLTSVQNSLPCLDVLKGTTYARCNYVYRFLILVLIDEIFIELHKEYRRLMELNPWI